MDTSGRTSPLFPMNASLCLAQVPWGSGLPAKQGFLFDERGQRELTNATQNRHVQFNSSIPAQFPEWCSNLQRSLPRGTCLCRGCRCSRSGLKPLELPGSEWMRQPPLAPAAPGQWPVPLRWACLASRREQRRSWRVAVLTRRRSSELGCTLRMRWGKCERASSCGACRSSWSCGGRRRRPGPETTAACSSLRWSAHRSLPGGRRRSLTCVSRPGRPGGPRTHCPHPARLHP